jgi:hypothetical protein
MLAHDDHDAPKPLSALQALREGFPSHGGWSELVGMLAVHAVDRILQANDAEAAVRHELNAVQAIDRDLASRLESEQNALIVDAVIAGATIGYAMRATETSIVELDSWLDRALSFAGLQGAPS